jgi:hypothetical protein
MLCILCTFPISLMCYDHSLWAPTCDKLLNILHCNNNNADKIKKNNENWRLQEEKLLQLLDTHVVL